VGRWGVIASEKILRIKEGRDGIGEAIPGERKVMGCEGSRNQGRDYETRAMTFCFVKGTLWKPDAGEVGGKDEWAVMRKGDA